MPCAANPRGSAGAPASWCSIGGLETFFGEYRLHGLQFTLTGDQGPIPEARVRWHAVGAAISGSREWVEGASDAHGKFSAAELEAGTWAVEVCAEGYRPMHGTIDIDPATPGHDFTMVAVRAARAAADRISVLEPSAVVDVDAGTAVHVQWRIENGPIDAKGWEIRVSVLGCAEGMSIRVIHAEPFKKAEGEYTWHATQEVIDWMKANDPDGSGLQLPIMVCLYDAAGRDVPQGVLVFVEDEELAHFEACHPFGDPSWLVCGSTDDNAGQGRLSLPALTAQEKAVKRYETWHPEALHAGGNVLPPRLLHRVDPEWQTIPAEERKGLQPVMIEAVVTTRGEVLEPEIISAAQPTVDDVAREAVRRWRYEPATLEGKPVAVFVTVQLTP